MGNYDDWKQQTPDEPMNNECDFCGEPCEGRYCPKLVKKNVNESKIKLWGKINI
jgi:hypothetical protein